MFVEAVAGAALLAACKSRDGWDDPAPPARIFGNTYYVGTCGISSILITSPRGHILIDGGTARGGPLIAANIERLGFRPRDVKWIVSSHEHFDHVGGIAHLQARSGARFAALASGTEALRSGRSGPDDPQFGVLKVFAPIRVDRQLRDGGSVTLGSLRVTAHAVPAHAPGGTSWSWRSCDKRLCRTVVYADSISAISADGYRFTSKPAVVQSFRAGMAKLAMLDCGILLTPHPSGSRTFERLAGQAPLYDPDACRAYSQTGLTNLNTRLAKEVSGK